MNPIIRRRRSGTVGSGGTGTALLWSDPATWGGTLPTSSDAVVVASTDELKLDMTGAVCLSLTINGKFTVDSTKDVSLTAGSVMNMGTWDINGGDITTPYAHRATFTINGARSTHTARPNNQGYTNDGLSRAINNHGIRRFFGTPPRAIYTKLATTAALGATSISVLGDRTDWVVGKDVVIAPTNLYGQSVSERRTITSIGSYSGGNTTIGFATPLVEKHWGVLQWPIDAPYGTNSISLSPNVVNGAIGGANTYTPPDADTPTILDERAEVIYLDGNIVIQAPADAAALTQGWGVHMMDHPNCTYQDTNVIVIRGGQQGAFSRYPYHAHKLSYADITAAITFTLTSGEATIVNWPGHGITPTTPRTAVVTFSAGAFGDLHCNWPGGETFLGSRLPISFSGGTLPTGIVAGHIYYVLMAGGDSAGSFYLSKTSVDIFSVDTVIYVNSGSGTITANATRYVQPVVFATSGTLPTGITAGQIYYTVGASIQLDSFAICTIDDNTFYQTTSLPIVATGAAGSGHTATITRFTVDRPDCFRRFCTVDTSYNRGFTDHASCGTELSDCNTYDTLGMTFFQENGSEERMLHQRLFALKVRTPPTLDCLKLFDIGGEAYGNGAIFSFSSGHWITNLNNTFIDCTAADVVGWGVWCSLALHCFGESALVAINPNITNILVWNRNGGHSCGKRGVALGIGVVDETGSTSGGAQSTRWSPPDRIALVAGIAWKCNQGGFFNQDVNAFYTGWTTADNCGVDFEGGTGGSYPLLTSSLLVGYSNIDAGDESVIVNDISTSTNPRRGGVASYHFFLLLKNLSFHNFPWQDAQYIRSGQQDYGGGAFMTRDLYTIAIAAQQKYNTGWKLNNSHPGFFSRSPRYAGYGVTMTMANPCVITCLDPNMSSVSILNDEPFHFVRSAGLPAAFALDTNYYIKNLSGHTFQLSLTVGGAAISTAGQTQTAPHDGMPMWRGYGSWVNFVIASAIPDPSGYWGKGSTGATPRWVIHDAPYFTDGAADLIAAEPSPGRAKSTTTGFVGFKEFQDNSNAPNTMGVSSELIDSSTEAVIDKFIVGPASVAGVVGFFQNFESCAFQDGRRYRITHPGFSKPTLYYACRMVAANRAASTFLLELPWDGTVTVGNVYRTSTFGVTTPYTPSAGAIAAGKGVVCTAATGATRADKIAAVLGSANGSIYYQDTAADSVFVRHTPLALVDAAAYAALGEYNGEKAEESSYIVLST